MNHSKWIWCAGKNLCEYNQTVLFKQTFHVNSPAGALLRITADSWYRVSINGQWIHDGPSRAYPNHWQYDEHEIGHLLEEGDNHIEVIARYFGVGSFKHIPQQAGLRAELHLGEKILGTDASWLAAPSLAWRQWTPKVSIQMEPVEQYDARLEKELTWQPAVEVKRPGKITARNTALLTKTPRRPKTLLSAEVVKKTDRHWCIPVARLAHPEVIEANFYTSRPVVLGAILTVKKKQAFDFSYEEKVGIPAQGSKKPWKVAVNGRLLKTGRITLPPGNHAVLFFCVGFYGHDKQVAFPFLNRPGMAWTNWKVCILEKFLFRDNDMTWFWFEHPEAKAMEQRYLAEIEILSSAWKRAVDELPRFGKMIDLSTEQIFIEDFAAEFYGREPVQAAGRLVDGRVVQPSRKGDVELCYDFGEETCGYFEFVIKAEAGVLVDLNMVEYITPEGVIQHTFPINRNGMRYITKAGVNRFTSLKRRAGRYLFVTLHNQTSLVEIRRLRIIESTAPVRPVAAFQSSDPILNRTWEISERTLRLCMEDTFTDCPLYEQILWTGDARNEALYAFAAYGNYEVSARSLELGMQSLEKLPMVGCQVPSAWDCLIPAWSFLWGMQVWEHYFHSGDKRLLKKLWPAVLKNLDGAQGHIDKNGLLSAELWNLIDWAPIEQSRTVLHNSMFWVGALQAAEHCAEVLGETAARKILKARRGKVIRAINRWWDDKKQSYPDAILENGTPSPRTCQHTSMLAIQYDIIPKDHRDAALANLLNPPAGITRIASPFAMQFAYEALEKTGKRDALIGSIREKFKPMLDCGATTVWESFPFSRAGDFPTRSHCHAWSSSPIWFLNRVVLGIRQIAPGGKAFEISPWVTGLQYARGATSTPHGPVSVDWKLKGKTLHIAITAPKGVRIKFVPNASHPETVKVEQR